MSVQWSKPHECYVWTCMFGCHFDQETWEFESAADATHAFVTHRCLAGGVA